jgi:hypothetical protein
MRDSQEDEGTGTKELAMDYRTLITLGRKAGLQTSELYQALSTRRPEAGDRAPGQADGNGFISTYGRNGQRVFLPSAGYRRP